jgi:hypothetical protein
MHVSLESFPEPQKEPAKIQFAFSLGKGNAARVRPLSSCNTAKDFFAEVKKTANVPGHPHKYPGHVVCKFPWGGIDHAVIEDDEEDFRLMIEALGDAPAGTKSTVMVSWNFGIHC